MCLASIAIHCFHHFVRVCTIHSYLKQNLIIVRCSQCVSMTPRYSSALSLVYTSVPNGLQTDREPNARMHGWNCKPVLHHSQTVCIPFATNRNLWFFTQTQRVLMRRVSFPCTGVLCSHQVHRKLINHRAPLRCRMRLAQCVSGALVYTKLYTICYTTLPD